MMDAFWAVPEWAPEGESHLLGSLSPVTRITYGAGTVTYSTFDSESTDVLRLDFVPDSFVGGIVKNRMWFGPGLPGTLLHGAMPLVILRNWAVMLATVE